MIMDTPQLCNARILSLGYVCFRVKVQARLWVVRRLQDTKSSSIRLRNPTVTLCYTVPNSYMEPHAYGRDMEPHAYGRSMVSQCKDTHEHLLSILHVNMSMGVSMMCLSLVRMDLIELWQIK